MPELTLHVTPSSHPCMAVEAALRLKGLEYERVELPSGPKRAEEVAKVYGDGATTVPGMLVDEERVHGSRPILARLEEMAPAPALYPEPVADAVREAERWADEDFQEVARTLPYGALHFRPEAAGTFFGAGTLDPAATDLAIQAIRGTWDRRGISAHKVAQDLAELPATLDRIDALAADGVVGGEAPTAADLHIGSTVRVLLTIGDLTPLLAGRKAEEIANRLFPEYPGEIPAGAFPPGWVPSP